MLTCICSSAAARRREHHPSLVTMATASSATGRQCHIHCRSACVLTAIYNRWLHVRSLADDNKGTAIAAFLARSSPTPAASVSDRKAKICTNCCRETARRHEMLILVKFCSFPETSTIRTPRGRWKSKRGSKRLSVTWTKMLTDFEKFWPVSASPEILYFCNLKINLQQNAVTSSPRLGLIRSKLLKKTCCPYHILVRYYHHLDLLFQNAVKMQQRQKYHTITHYLSQYCQLSLSQRRTY